MKACLLLLFASIFAAMTIVTVRASWATPIWAVDPRTLADPWFHATLADAYFGFLTFYVWLAYRERGWVARITWFALVMLLGNFAMSAYLLWQIAGWNPHEGILALLVPKNRPDGSKGSPA